MKVAIVGAGGAVGTELQNLCKGWHLSLFGSQDEAVYRGLDFAFFCAGSDVSKREIPKAREVGVRCFDASSAFRSDPQIPLVIPEINGHLVKSSHGMIASPNCTTTFMLLPLAPIHKEFRIKRIIATTFQAVSGAGFQGIKELKEQLSQSGKPCVFPVPCAHNVFLHESPLDASGYCIEEIKMQSETCKILEDSSIAVTARCVRVPVFRSHAISLNVEVQEAFSLEKVHNLIANAPGVTYRNHITALDATGEKSVFCGNLRRDLTCEKAFELWVCGDQLLKGAALNLYQLATY